MSSDFGHLMFHKTVKRKAKFPGGGGNDLQTRENKNNRPLHVRNLSSNISHLEQYYNAYFASKGEDDAEKYEVPFVLKLDPETDLFDELYKYGLEVISEEEDGFVIVATNREGINQFKSKLNGFQNNITGSGKVAEIYEISINDIPGKKLSEYLFTKWPFVDTEEYIVDISIDCKGLEPFHISKQRRRESDEQYLQRCEIEKLNKYANWEEFLDKRNKHFSDFIEPYKDEYTIIRETMDNYDNLTPPETFEIRLMATGKVLRDITMNYPYLFEISEIDAFSSEPTSLVEEFGYALEINPPSPNSPIVGVVDSGIQEGHRFLEPAIVSELSKSYVDNESQFDLVVNGGHGTRVTGKILYPKAIPSEGSYNLPCYVANCKILDNDCKMPERNIPALIYADIIEDYSDEVKIFNSSVNSAVPCRTRHMSSWAAQVDKSMNENDVLFIQSAGNILSSNSSSSNSKGIKELLDDGLNYPEYLYESPSSRIANPAQSMFALTVGSVSENEYSDELSELKSLEKTFEPSSFSRTGFGLWGSIKPEVAEIGGGLVVDTSNNLSKKSETSIETTRTSPPGEAFSKDEVGTSFSTPKVSYLAAKIQEQFPGQPALLYKALIVHSANWPEWAQDEELTDEQKVKIIRSMGYGIPREDYALTNTPHRVTFITSGKVEINAADAHLYYIPVPESLRDPALSSDIKITITLCYTANPRRTRIKKKGYLSTWLDWIASKPDDDLDNFEKRVFKDTDRPINHTNYQWTLGSKEERDGCIDGISRNNSATQKDWQILKSYQLPKEFAIAVRSHVGWDKDPFSKANYVLVVSMEAIKNDLEIYSEIKAELEAEIAAVATIPATESEIELDT